MHIISNEFKPTLCDFCPRPHLVLRIITQTLLACLWSHRLCHTHIYCSPGFPKILNLRPISDCQEISLLSKSWAAADVSLRFYFYYLCKWEKKDLYNFRGCSSCSFPPINDVIWSRWICVAATGQQSHGIEFPPIQLPAKSQVGLNCQSWLFILFFFL